MSEVQIRPSLLFIHFWIFKFLFIIETCVQTQSEALKKVLNLLFEPFEHFPRGPEQVSLIRLCVSVSSSYVPGAQHG